MSTDDASVAVDCLDEFPDSRFTGGHHLPTDLEFGRRDIEYIVHDPLDIRRFDGDRRLDGVHRPVAASRFPSLNRSSLQVEHS